MGDEATSPARLEQVSIALPEPVRIEGTIDRGKFPDAGRVAVQLVGEAWSELETRLDEGQTKFEFRDLPPGEYHVSIQSKPVASKGARERTPRAASPTSRVRLKAGETKAVAF